MASSYHHQLYISGKAAKHALNISPCVDFETCASGRIDLLVFRRLERMTILRRGIKNIASSIEI